jgi:hypothetical protein
MPPDVAEALARLGRRERFTGEDDFVFANDSGLPINGGLPASAMKPRSSRWASVGFASTTYAARSERA